MNHHRQGIAARPASSGWFLALLSCWLAVLAANAAAFRVTLDPPSVRAGEAARLALVFENCRPDTDVPLPSIPGLTLSGGAEMTSQSFINGQASSTFTKQFLVAAAAPGTYTIPAITAQVGGRAMASQPVQFQVLPAGAAVPNQNNQVVRAFTRIEPARTNVFVGEVLPVDVAVYAIDPKQWERPAITAEGFTVGKIEQAPQSRTQINGIYYTRLALRTTVIPTKAGLLTLGPVKCRVAVPVPLARRRANDPMEDFFNDPFFSRTAEVVYMEAQGDALRINVQPLPTTQVPASFTGAVGSYSFEVTAGPTNVAAGEPVHLRVQVSGRGALESIALPPQDGWKDFRVYPAVTRVELTDALGTEGSKIFEQDIVPQTADAKAVPSLTFSFFDPANRVYVSLTNAPIPLIVRPASGGRGLSADTGNAPVTREIVHLKPRLGTLAAIAAPLVSRPWFMVLSVLPLLGWIAAVLVRRQRERLARDPRLRRHRAVSRHVRRGLTELEALTDAARSAEFFAAVFRLLQEQLGERLDLPAASITESVLEERLRPAGVDAALLTELHGLFQTCNQARYAPTASTQDLRDTANRLERVLRGLQEVKL